MKNKTMTPQQKSERGLTLSAADIQELLKDPNSWVAKLYSECLLVAAITHHEFVHLVHVITLEHKLAAQELTTKEILHAERSQEKEAKYYAELYAKTLAQDGNERLASLNTLSPTYTQPALNLPILKQEMSQLLTKPQHTMTLTQLAAHHKEVTANFNNQVAAVLGATITLPIKVNNEVQNIVLAVPQMTSRPAVSVPQLLARNPVLRSELSHDATQKKHFVQHTTMASLRHLAVLNKWREMYKQNKHVFHAAGIDAKNIMLTPQMLKLIDQAVSLCLKDNDKLLACLCENNTRALDVTTPDTKNVSGLHLPKLSMFAKRVAKISEESTPSFKPSSSSCR